MITVVDEVFLVADPVVRRAKVWTRLRCAKVHAFDRRKFSVETRLPADVSVLLYQIGARFADTVKFLGRVFTRQSDLRVILIGNDAGGDRAARLLRQGAYDYLAWPCPASRLSEAIESCLANRRTVLEVRNLSDELARTNHTLAQDRDELAQCKRHLLFLHQLTQVMAGTLETDAVVKALFARLPSLIAADRIGLVRSDPEQVWSWSQPQDGWGANALHSQLLGRLGSTEGRTTSSHRVLRLLRSPHLSLVPMSGNPVQGPDDRSVSVHEVSLAIGSHGAGILHVERARERPFTGQEQQLLATIAVSLSVALDHADAHRQIRELALRDPLTGVLNRRALDGPLHRELKAGLRYGTPACLLLLDLDYFKTVNDLLGHVAGDGVLAGVAELVQETVREVDSVSRYDGEKFAVVLPHTDLGQAQTLAERIRVEIERHAFDLDGGHVRITASLGVAGLRESSIATVGHWISAADSALYKAKSEGRNRVAVHATSRLAPSCAAALRAVA